MAQIVPGRPGLLSPGHYESGFVVSLADEVPGLILPAKQLSAPSVIM